MNAELTEPFSGTFSQNVIVPRDTEWKCLPGHHALGWPVHIWPSESPFSPHLYHSTQWWATQPALTEEQVAISSLL